MRKNGSDEIPNEKKLRDTPLGDIISQRKARVKVCLLLSGAGHLLSQEKLRYCTLPAP